MKITLFFILSIASLSLNAQCILKCNLNVGYYSDDNPATIGYDNMGSSFHSTYIAIKGGFLVWGESMENLGTATSHNYSPLMIDSINYPALTGEVHYVGIGSSSLGAVQMIVLSSQGLFASGITGAVLSTGIKSTNVFSKLTINGKSDGLPTGMTPDSVKMMFVTHRSIYLTSCSGYVYVLSQDSNVRGTKGLSIGSATAWSKVMDTSGTPLSNVIVTRGQGRFAYALKSDSTIWTWGDSVMKGNGTSSKNYNYAIPMTKPAGLTGIKMIQATSNGYNTGAARVSYYILGTDKKVYSLGANASGQLGDRTSVAKYVWVNAKNPNGTIIDSAIWISSNEHDNVNPNYGVLKSNGQVYVAGNNNGTMIGRAGTLNFLDTPAGILNTDTITFFKIGGHTSAFKKLNEPKYGYIGHRANGSLGNGSTVNTTISTADFVNTAPSFICGTSCDTPTIELMPYKCTDTQAIFIIKSKVGNKIKYQLNSGSLIDSIIGIGDSLRVIVKYPPLDLIFKITQVSSNLCFLTLNNTIRKLNTYSVVDTNISICSNQFYKLGTKTYNTAGTYKDTLQNIRLCDSFVTVHLTVKSITFDTIDSSLCQGKTMVFKGKILNKTGVYFDTLVNADNCDSIIRLQLTVYKWDTTQIFDSVCLGRNYLFNGNNLTADGIYWDTLINKKGCDSFIRLDFKFYQTVKTFVSDSFCINKTYNFNGKIKTIPGIYRDTIPTSSGCDSIVTLTLDYYKKDSTILYDSICVAGHLYFNDMNINLAGTYLDTLKNRHNCDSFIFLKLSIYNKKDTTVLYDSFCDRKSYYFNSKYELTPGVYWDTLLNKKGCDSFIKLYLSFYKNDTAILNTYYCQGRSYYFNEKYLSTIGTYWDTLINKKGCDSFIKLNLSEKLSDTTRLYKYFCEGHSYYFNEVYITTVGVYWDTLINRFGCDSFIILNLSKVKKDTTIYSDTICYGKQRTLNGKNYTKPGTYAVDTFFNLKGCDSIIILKLWVDTPIYKTNNYYGCNTYKFRTVDYTLAKTIIDTFKFKNGCDSFIHIHNIIIKNPLILSPISISFCDSTSVLGKKYFKMTSFTDTIKSKIIACDSIIQAYNLTAYYRVKMNISISPQKDTYRRGEVVLLQTKPASNYIWNTGETTPFISVKLYNDSVCNVIGWNHPLCKDTSIVKIKTNDESTIQVPTGFSPNGDGYNDILYCRGFGIRKLIQFKIFNRLGQLIYSTSDMNEGWDGYYKGMLQNTDTYFYYYEGETYAPVRKIKGEGNFMLMK
jgi:gliding motility-associated-like protein